VDREGVPAVDFALAPCDKRDLEEACCPPFNWSRLRGDEVLRVWHTLDGSPRVLHLMHGTGAENRT
jgi:hypothetical protein